MGLIRQYNRQYNRPDRLGLKCYLAWGGNQGGGGGGQGSWAGPSWFRPGLGGWGGGWVGGEGHESGWGGGQGSQAGPSWFPPGLGGVGRGVGGGEGHESGWGGGGERAFFRNVIFFNYFRHDKSEPYLTDDCIFVMFLNFLPNRFRLNMEPHELIWTSVTAILHILSVSIFFSSKSEIFGT